RLARGIEPDVRTGVFAGKTVSAMPSASATAPRMNWLARRRANSGSRACHIAASTGSSRFSTNGMRRRVLLAIARFFRLLALLQEQIRPLSIRSPWVGRDAPAFILQLIRQELVHALGPAAR